MLMPSIFIEERLEKPSSHSIVEPPPAPRLRPTAAPIDLLEPLPALELPEPALDLSAPLASWLGGAETSSRTCSPRPLRRQPAAPPMDLLDQLPFLELPPAMLDQGEKDVDDDEELDGMIFVLEGFNDDVEEAGTCAPSDLTLEEETSGEEGPLSFFFQGEEEYAELEQSPRKGQDRVSDTIWSSPISNFAAAQCGSASSSPLDCGGSPILSAMLRASSACSTCASTPRREGPQAKVSANQEGAELICLEMVVQELRA